MKTLLLIAAIIGLSLSATLDDEWVTWKSSYAKVYDDEATESVRRLVWENNWRFVQQHNSEGHSYEVEMNEFADLVSRRLVLSVWSSLSHRKGPQCRGVACGRVNIDHDVI